jgi:hypothetical protein
VTVIAPPNYQALGTLLAEQAERPLEWPGLGRRTPPPFLLVLAADSAELARITMGHAPAWGAGVALPGARAILLRADLPDIRQTLRHELGHLVLRDAVRTRLPLWFDEGYASWGAGELGRLDVLSLNLAVASGKVPDFRELDGMLRGSATSAELAYALAASALEELARRPPPGGLAPLLTRLEAGEEFEPSLEAATGLTVTDFEEVWQQHLRRRYGLFTWLVAGGMWVVLAFSLAGLLWYRRRADRPRRAALDQGWELPPPDDAGPPPVPVDPATPRQ